jgi:hypothetical protein
MLKIDTSNNTVAGFWVAGHDYFVRIEGTTVDAATINSMVAHFSIENRFMRGTDSANTTVPDAAGVAPTAVEIRTEMDNNSTKMAPSQTLADYKATGFNTVVPDAAGVAPTAAEIQTQIEGAGSKILAIEGDTNELQTNQGNWLTATGFSTHSAANVWAVGTRALTDKSGFALLSTGADLILKDSTFALAMADATWDEILTGATHNIATSAGKRLRQVSAFAIHGDTAQTGNATTITLAAAASGDDGVYNRNLISIAEGTGAGQTRQIADYNGTSKVASVDREWRVQPNATSVYQITADNVFALVDQGLAVAATSTTITLRPYASSVNDTYLCNQVAIIAGTGRGQCRLIGSYNGTTKVATICGDNWVTIPDATSTYVLLPYGTTCTSCVGTHALGQINTECDTALTDYDPPTRTEATSDKAAIITEVDANETKIDALNNISVADIIAGVSDGALDLQEMMRIILAATAGKSTGGGTVTLTFRDSADSKARITATVDASGNRTAMTLDGA